MLKIVSGGQTGVDRAALDCALQRGIDCGGWCPEGRLAEDGRIPPAYPVTELPGGGYPERTRKNVQDSDGTVIIYLGELSGGTEKTLLYCLDEGKPYLLLDAREIGAPAERPAPPVRAARPEPMTIRAPRSTISCACTRPRFEVN